MRVRHLLIALALGIIGINLAWVLWLGLPFTHMSPRTTCVPAEQITLAHVL
jgi:hypothetical protein